MNPAIVILASQVLAAAVPASPPPAPASGARVTAMATVEILPSGTTRANEENTLARHQRTTAHGTISFEFE